MESNLYELGLKPKIPFFQQQLLSWFKDHGRHYFSWRQKNLSAYEIVIAEILLQRTKAETVERFYKGFLTAFPNWETIANSGLNEIEAQFRPMGLSKQRAKRLNALATEMLALNGNFPVERKTLEQMPFLGQYIANAIELQLFNRPRPLLDVNMARVIERYFGERKLSDIRYDPYLQSLAHNVINHKHAKDINWAILDFAAAICKARKPMCNTCLLSNTCIFNK